MADPFIGPLQSQLNRVSLLRNRSYELRIGPLYCSVFANGQLVNNFSSIAEATFWLSQQTNVVRTAAEAEEGEDNG